MSKSVVIAAALVALAMVSAGVFTHAASASAQDAAPGKYKVVANEKAFVLYDTEDTTRTWILIPAAGEEKHAWLPVKRLDTDQQAQNWNLLKSAGQ